MAAQTASKGTPAIVPSVIYKDPEGAMAWLERAYGFEPSMIVRGPDGKPSHIELTLGDALIYLGGEDWADWIAAPCSLGGKTTAVFSVAVNDVDAHHARAKEAGAKIVAPPEDQFYGDRVYRALDLEGHFWTFHQKVRAVSIAEMEKLSSFKIETRK